VEKHDKRVSLVTMHSV